MESTSKLDLVGEAADEKATAEGCWARISRRFATRASSSRDDADKEDVTAGSHQVEDELCSPQSRRRRQRMSAPSLGAAAFVSHQASGRSRRSRSRSPMNDGSLPFVFEICTVQKRMYMLRTVGGDNVHEWVQAIKDAQTAEKQAWQQQTKRSCWQQVMHIKQTPKAGI